MFGFSPALLRGELMPHAWKTALEADSSSPGLGSIHFSVFVKHQYIASTVDVINDEQKHKSPVLLALTL